MPAGPVNNSALSDAAFGVAQQCVDRGALGGATDEKVALTRASGIGHARHDTGSGAASRHSTTADRPVLSNVSSPVAADEAGDLGACGGPEQAP
jgi:hypothetical protein